MHQVSNAEVARQIHRVSNADVVAVLSDERTGTPHSNRVSVRVIYYERSAREDGWRPQYRPSVGSAADESCFLKREECGERRSSNLPEVVRWKYI